MSPNDVKIVDLETGAIEENLEAFSKGNNMKSMAHASRKITAFLQNNLKCIDKQPNLAKLFDRSFVEAYVTQ